jgi:hypothetical protein
LWSEFGLAFKWAALGNNPSDNFFRFGDNAVAWRSTAIAAGVAFLITGFIHFTFQQEV